MQKWEKGSTLGMKSSPPQTNRPVKAGDGDGDVDRSGDAAAGPSESSSSFCSRLHCSFTEKLAASTTAYTGLHRETQSFTAPMEILIKS